ncbi:hypothetical protein FACS1894187_21480 [Synergistales bacterium]|nr:hypothetical protein FACS1894187_21480 [Synergistales bacterium]
MVSAAASADIKSVASGATRGIIEGTHRNDFGVSFSSGKKNDVYNIGDAVTMTFSSKEDAYLTILNFTAGGRMIVLYPNKRDSDNHVRAGEEIRIPAQGKKFSMKAGGPAGVDVVKAVATNNNVKVVGLGNLGLVDPFTIIEDAKPRMLDIVLLDEDDDAPGGAKNIAPLKWSVASLAIVTLDPSKADQLSGVVTASKGDWTVKMWTNGAYFLTGDLVFVKFLSNKNAKLVSLVNEGDSTGNMLPDSSERGLLVGEILVLPGKNDNWKLIAASKAKKDVVKAKLSAEDGDELELVLEVTVEE